MEAREILGLKPPRLQNGHRQRIAHRQGGGAARRGGKLNRAGFFFHVNVQHGLRRAPKGGVLCSGDGDERRAQTREDGQDAHHLVRLAAVGERDDGVVFRHHAQIAVNALGGVQEIRGRARAREGGGNLLSDQPALPHAGDRDLALAPQDDIDRLDEPFIQPGDEPCERFGLDTERPRAPFYRIHGRDCFSRAQDPSSPESSGRKISPHHQGVHEGLFETAPGRPKSLLPPPPMLEIIVRMPHEDECPSVGEG